jgi:hypothetical protein
MNVFYIPSDELPAFGSLSKPRPFTPTQNFNTSTRFSLFSKPCLSNGWQKYITFYHSPNVLLKTSVKTMPQRAFGEKRTANLATTFAFFKIIRQIFAEKQQTNAQKNILTKFKNVPLSGALKQRKSRLAAPPRQWLLTTRW